MKSSDTGSSVMKSSVMRAAIAAAAIPIFGGLVAPRGSLAAGQELPQPDRAQQILDMQFASRRFRPPPPPISGAEADHAYEGAFGAAARHDGAAAAPSGGTTSQ